MPNGRFDVIRELVSKTAVTERAGFASLYKALSDAIPERGNFLEWLETAFRSAWRSESHYAPRGR
ncbi:hypothetical protein [Candidatus Symbiopectobacterium sp. PLON1]|uniref:hypothetical protein n=1 Tax=Candidatus Symbiopectobacterium sp. PLON1 TaxID=2794575 RepID=UPI001A1EEBA4|nr:hypothetical protein [Candidatus Symbiopectobacterium sp. PLON1]MBG6246829.1 hypothetical protein [Candidatus Symbiopectobacterium sp. PLON1]